MKVSIFGLGYVGSVTAACLASQGNKIIGVDVVDSKVDTINSGRWPIYEPGLDKMGVFQKKLVIATKDVRKAINESDVSLVCVGTPSLPDGSVDLTYLKNTILRINKVLRNKKGRHILLIRSTAPPGTLDKFLLPILSAKQRKFTAYYPEFLREGTAIKDFFEPSLNVIGINKGFPTEILKKLMPDLKVELQTVDIKTSESIKYANNSFHALKIVFTNEIAQFCKAYGSDADKVMELFCRDAKLNLSPYYLRPGFAFGGSCLPKELRALSALMRAKNTDPILIESIDQSNEKLIDSFISLMMSLKPSSIGYVGVTFKPNTDDLRESSVMRAVDKINLRNRSYSKSVRQFVFDNTEALLKIRETASEKLTAVDSLEELIKESDIVVLGPYKLNLKDESKLIRSGKNVVDLKWFRVGTALKNYRKYHSLV